MGIEQIIKNTDGTCMKQRMYTTRSLEELSASAMYMKIIGPKGGKMKIIDLPASGVQLHIHTDQSGNRINRAHYIKHGENKQFQQVDNYQAAMADYYAGQLGLKKIDTSTSGS